MVQFLTERIDAIKMSHNAREKNDSHRMTVVYIEHFETIIGNVKTIFNKCLADGPLRSYLHNMQEHNA